MRDYALYLKDILAAIESILSFLHGMDLESFQADDKTVSAVIRKLEIMGEAAKRIPDTVRQQHPEVPWKLMAAMRDRLIHFYSGVDKLLVWKTVEEHLPTLKASIQAILEQRS